MADWPKEVHEQYLRVLDERDEAIEDQDKAFKVGIIIGIVYSMLVVDIFILLYLILSLVF